MISCRTIKPLSRFTWIKKDCTTPMAPKLRSSEATSLSILGLLFLDHLRRWQSKILLHIASQLSQTLQETHLNSSLLGSSIPFRQGKSKSLARDQQRTKRSHPPQQAGEAGTEWWKTEKKMIKLQSNRERTKKSQVRNCKSILVTLLVRVRATNISQSRRLRLFRRRWLLKTLVRQQMAKSLVKPMLRSRQESLTRKQSIQSHLTNKERKIAWLSPKPSQKLTQTTMNNRS